MQSGPVRTLMRWLLPAFLAVAVLGMHHLPAAGPGDRAAHHQVVPSPDTTAGPVGERSGCCRSSSPAAEPSDDVPGGHGAGHELLHLCLVILTALAGIALVLFALVRGPAWSVSAAETPRPPPVVCARPPPAHSRRLAALGVLRL
ncbi:hypothetical protein [Nocardia sp. NPDC051750]|uniref:hypothetical protein n=1 Tax=Nocardia sp. NPDC051750 TaxID=3364325 RepID=UPI003790C4D8